MENSTTTFSEREDQALGTYRTVSWLAIAALIFGLLSCLALVHPAVWFVPILALVFSLLALGHVARREEMVGGGLATLGMTLALFFGSWGVSEYFTGRSVIYREARVVAEDWLRMILDGDTKVAHQAMMSAHLRQVPGMSLDEFYQHDEKSKRQMDEFFGLSPASDILAVGPNGSIRFVANLAQKMGFGSARFVEQTYEISSPDHAPIQVIVTVSRSPRDGLGRTNWQISGLSPIDS